MTRKSLRAAAEGLPEITRRLFLLNTASAGAVLATAAAPAMAVQPVDPVERVAAAVEKLKAALAAYAAGRSGQWQACLIQRDDGRVVHVVSLWGAHDKEELILDRDGKPARKGGAS